MTGDQTMVQQFAGGLTDRILGEQLPVLVAPRVLEELLDAAVTCSPSRSLSHESKAAVQSPLSRAGVLRRGGPCASGSPRRRGRCGTPEWFLDSFRNWGKNCDVQAPDHPHRAARALGCASPARGSPCWAPCRRSRTPTPTPLIGAVRRELPAVSHQAVYDALRALTDAGLIRRIQPLGSVARYEARVGDNHHHVVCRSCGAIADVDCAVGDTPCLTASDDHGFAIDEAEVIYWGMCPACSSASPDTVKPTPDRRMPRRDTASDRTCQREREPGHRRARAQAAVGRAATRTGGPTSSTCRCCTSTRRSPTRWARTSTTPRSSRASTSRRSSGHRRGADRPRRTGGRPTSATTAA